MMFSYIILAKKNRNELSGAWGKKLFESDNIKILAERSYRTPRVFPMLQSSKGAVFLPPMLLLLLATKV